MKTVTIVYGKTHICDGLVGWEIKGIFCRGGECKKMGGGKDKGMEL